jgi:hypothetical protein
VEGERNSLYKMALDWKQKKFPAEVVDLLVEYSSQGVADKGKWLSLLQFVDEWKM